MYVHVPGLINSILPAQHVVSPHPSQIHFVRSERQHFIHRIIFIRLFLYHVSITPNSLTPGSALLRHWMYAFACPISISASTPAPKIAM
jgi:hypothetical protein